MVQKVLFRRAHDRAGALGSWRNAFAENEDLARQRVRRRGPSVYAIDAINAEYETVILGLIAADEPANHLRHLRQDIGDAPNDPLVAGAAQQNRTLSDPHRALQLDCWSSGREPLGAGHPFAPLVDRFIARGPHQQNTFGLGDTVGIALFIETVGGNRHRGSAPFGVHAVEHEAVALKRREYR